MATKKLHFETLQVHVGQEQADPATDARAVPIYQTTSYVFHDSQHAADRFGLRDAGNIYGRLTNSTQGVFEARVAALEGGVAGLAVASGAAAVTYALQNILGVGDHIVAADNLYGGSFNLITHTLAAQGITHTIVNVNDLQALEAAIRENTKAVYVETFGNPNSDVTNIDAVAEVAHRHNIPLIVDNTFGTPYLIRPIEHGADIVVHSATKFIGGHGSSLGGVLWTVAISIGKQIPISSRPWANRTQVIMERSLPTWQVRQLSAPASGLSFCVIQELRSRLSMLLSCCKVWKHCLSAWSVMLPML